MFKKLWKFFIIIFIVICIFFPVLAPMLAQALATSFPLLSQAITAVGAALSQLGAWGYVISGAVGVGLAYAIDPETTSEAIADVAAGVGTIVEGVIDVASGAVSAVAGNLMPLLLGGLALLFFWRKDRDEVKATPASSDAASRLQTGPNQASSPQLEGQ